MMDEAKTVWIIAKREFKAYFLSPIAYVYLITFLVLVNWLFFKSFFLMGQADLRALFGMMPWVFLFFVPAVSMGKWAEERKLGTLEILFTLPIRDESIVVGKFIAGLALIVCAILMTLPAAFTVFLLGDMDLGPAIGGYIGTIFLGGAYLAIGLTVSSLTENQIIAFIIAVVACFLMLVIGTPLVVGGTGGMLSSALQYAGLAAHFDSISRGVVDSRDVIYYLSAILFFLFVNFRILKNRARK